ncbi:MULTISPECIES: CPBP family intramembrane glutamic endopeptidase [Roseofilum]|uniref:Abortive phage infection protein n=1 Tax=Roseofilum reptotaenium AO1-A TaxID=1925591 RepID=A0A1L9QSX0_9CYAN|nr:MULTISPECIES: CPBP family intramembrane glutamic endopeptidase [Roseofilum]OJJ25687.1 abortive phage infection protein [Roseofilum reptotaenium AO1-A]MBP0012738.1 CPBP family intramembrane metalloprotease [Roseofilum sp. SID3]MBP0026288.1 CPBP family intramembrane metalloprotease [Roseofilum sp. SID2]MBP0027786.1 CPBP family intramembrane metalloprotease [Roseofilum sp. Guam]MBP0037106.1 CPBP family intramembrane metalloprotease [Roseofilum sp. SID1]
MSDQHNPDLEPMTRSQILIAMGVTAVILLIIAKLWLAIGSIVHLRAQWELGKLAIGILLGLGITAASALVYSVWPAYRQSADVYLGLVLKPLTYPDILWLGLLPGLSEEFLFRGVMLPALGLNFTGLILSSLCFGVLHLSGSNQWPYVIWATLVGLALGYSALATGNLLVPILAHILTNLVSSFTWKMGNPT